MSTLAQLQTERTTAGATYVAAVAALKVAYVDLAGIDMTLANRKVNAAPLKSFHRDRLELIQALQQFRHDEYLPSIDGNWDAAVTASAEVRIGAYPTTD